MTKKQVTTVTGLFFIWRIALFGLALMVNRVLPYAPSFPYATTLLPGFGLPQWIYSFANFDGVHYLTIAREGYLSTNFIQAFFPVFPYVILHGLHTIIPSLNLLTAGLVIANGAFLGFLLVSFEYVSQKYSERVAWRFLLAIILFPWSIFLASLYTESLFLLFMILCFWFSYKKKWYAASIATALLSATRIVGVMMVPTLWIELWQSGNRNWKDYLVVTLGSLGLVAYMGYLYIHFGDPLYFLHVQAAFGAGRSNGITLYPQVAYRSLKILLTTTRDLKYVTYLQEFLAGTIGLLAIVWPYKKVSPAIIFFGLANALIPTVSGSFLSIGRFLLPCLSIYLLIAFFASRHPRLGILWYGISMIIMVINAILFLQGYWVA